MKKLFLLLITLIGSLSANADTWVLIGKGYYEDPFFVNSNNTPVSGDVYVEQCEEIPGYFRFKPLFSNPVTPYVYVHCENYGKAYVEKYSAIFSNGVTVDVVQRCSENNWSETSYGTLNNNEVVIPGPCFSYKTETAPLWTFCRSHRKFYLRLPPEGDESKLSGIYFGITAFNHLPKFMPIGLIDSSNKYIFQDFVNSQEMDDYTYLYYSVDKAIDAMISKSFPTDLNSAAIITFTDGNDDGSLEVAPNTSWTDIDYQHYVGDKIKNTFVQRNRLEAFSIGLKGEDIGDYNYELFKSNLLALASDSTKATEVNNMSEVERTLNQIIDKLQKSWLNTKVQVRINMRGTGDRIRFTLDKSRTEMNNNPNNSNLWIEGVFNRADLSLNDIQYHGCTSTSGEKVVAETVVDENDRTKYQFTFQNLRDSNDEHLKTGEIHFWHKNESTPAWQPHTEFGGGSDVKTETDYSSAVIMLVMDCSSSLGETDFAKLKSVVNSLVARLADKKSGIENVTVDEPDAPIEYYNLQGIRVENPTSGIYIRRQGNKATKVLIK